MPEPMSPDPAAAPAATDGWVGRVGKDLGPRVASALVLGALALGLLWAGAVPFALLVGAVGIVLSWEWGRVVRGGGADAVMFGHIAAVVIADVLAALGLTGIALLALAIGVILVLLLAQGRHPGLSALGVLYAGLPSVALLWLRESEPFGFLAVLFVMLTVVVTDVAAYFSGRLIGGPRLWPAVSPNKTWAGLGGAVAASALFGAIYAQFVPARAVPLAALAVLLAVIAQAGDLAESALKRRFGAKDASALIPGHGGFMDRVDGLVTASVAAALIAAAVAVQSPARALLQW
jgi:phosphatidate cytidylyltransferase